MELDLNNLANAYLRNQRSPNKDADFWAWEEVRRIVLTDLDAGWKITLLLLEKAESDDEVGYIAAGPLEDLIDIHGHKALDRIEEAAITTPRLQLALSTVGVLFYYEEFDRWYDLLCRYGFRQGLASDSRSVISKVMQLMNCYLNETIGAVGLGVGMSDLLDKPLGDKAAQRILQGVCYDVERLNTTTPPEYRTQQMLREPELRARVGQSLRELEALGYRPAG